MDETDEANVRTQQALNALWKYSHEFFIEDETDKHALASGIGVDCVP